MNKIGLISLLAAVLAIGGFSLLQAADKPATAPTTSPADKGPDVDKLRNEQLPAVLKSLEAATKAVESGDKTTALAELAKARLAVAAIQTDLGKYASKGKIVNARCPIMGGVIDPAKTPDTLTREYKGQKVGFCCAGCPAQWDKLTDAEKDAKLKAAMTPAK